MFVILYTDIRIIGVFTKESAAVDFIDRYLKREFARILKLEDISKLAGGGNGP